MHNIKVTITKRSKISNVTVESGTEKTHHGEGLFIDLKEEAQERRDTRNRYKSRVRRPIQSRTRYCVKG